jgi:hypothetical protein
MLPFLSVSLFRIIFKKQSLLLTHLLLLAGQPTGDSEVTSYILAGLPSDCDSLVTSVTTRLDSISLDDLYGYLSTHELCLE